MVAMYSVAAILYLSLTCSLALSWPRKTNYAAPGHASATARNAGDDTTRRRRAIPNDKPSDPVTEAEISALLSNQGALSPNYRAILISHHITIGSLENYSRRPDCFRKAADLIRAHCGQLDMDEGARVDGNEHTSHRSFFVHSTF
jgi:hypothetical protein